MLKLKLKQEQRGQALVETALVAVVLVIFVYGILSLIPAHRARTIANAAALACAQFISQAPEDPQIAATMGYLAAQDVINGWTETRGASFVVRPAPPAGRGQPGYCTVEYTVPGWFVFGGGTHSTYAISRGESWKADWD